MVHLSKSTEQRSLVQSHLKPLEDHTYIRAMEVTEDRIGAEKPWFNSFLITFTGIEIKDSSLLRHRVVCCQFQLLKKGFS